MGTSVSDMVIMLHILFYTDLGREAYAPTKIVVKALGMPMEFS